MSHIEFTLKNLRDRAAQRKPGYMAAVMIVATKNGNVLSISRSDFDRIRKDFSLPLFNARPMRHRVANVGPGTELHKILGKLGLKPTAGCKCRQRINIMNTKGSQWCRDNIDTIVEWLREEAKRSGILFAGIVARHLIKRAISNFEKSKVKPIT